jgi:hypothetical protein
MLWCSCMSQPQYETMLPLEEASLTNLIFGSLGIAPCAAWQAPAFLFAQSLPWEVVSSASVGWWDPLLTLTSYANLKESLPNPNMGRFCLTSKFPWPLVLVHGLMLSIIGHGPWSVYNWLHWFWYNIYILYIYNMHIYINWARHLMFLLLVLIQINQLNQPVHRIEWCGKSVALSLYIYIHTYNL